MTGVVLIGGKSSRMGQDKAMLLLGDRPLYKIAAEKIAPFCDNIYLSANQDQTTRGPYEYPVIQDTFEAEGPVGGIVSSHRCIKDTLLIISCDLPLITDDEITALIHKHKEKKDCTMFYNVFSGYYEPMLSIWDVRILDMLEKYFLSGGRSLQYFLELHHVDKNEPSSLQNFTNINTVDDWIKIDLTK
jgi:molybdenum cofactor guanylyltransferase